MYACMYVWSLTPSRVVNATLPNLARVYTRWMIYIYHLSFCQRICENGHCKTERRSSLSSLLNNEGKKVKIDDS